MGALAVGGIALMRLSKIKGEIEGKLAELARNQNSSRKTINEVLTGNMGIVKKFQELEHSVSKLSDKQADLELQEPEGRMYTRAKKMIQLGADINEVVRECEIPQAEAELLFSVAGKNINNNVPSESTNPDKKFRVSPVFGSGIKSQRNEQAERLASLINEAQNDVPSGNQAAGIKKAFGDNTYDPNLSRKSSEELAMMQRFKELRAGKSE